MKRKFLFPHILLSFFFTFCMMSKCSFVFAETEPLSPPETHCINPDEQFEFADQYFRNGEFDKAGREYNRFIYFFPEDQRAKLALYRMGKSYYAGGRYEQAKDVFEKLIRRYEKSDLALKAYFDMSHCFVKLNDLGSAVAVLKHLTRQTDKQEIIDTAWYEIGWLHIDNPVVAENHQWEKAEASFNKVSTGNRKNFAIDKLVAELNQVEHIPQKNPKLAGFLSIIPGGGFAYCNRYQDAFIAFLLNGGLIWATILSFENDNPALGGVIGFVETGFYAGNFYGGITSAHKYNRDQTQNFIQELKEKTKIRLWSNEVNKNIVILFETEFD